MQLCQWSAANSLEIHQMNVIVFLGIQVSTQKFGEKNLGTIHVQNVLIFINMLNSSIDKV